MAASREAGNTLVSTADDLPPLSPKSPGIPKDKRYREQYGVVLVCPDEASQAALYGALEALRTTKIKVVVT